MSSKSKQIYYFNLIFIRFKRKYDTCKVDNLIQRFIVEWLIINLKMVGLTTYSR